MTFRGQKGTDPFSTKTSRNERFAQMSQQELLIEQKKREIQAKLAQKKEPEVVNPPATTSSKPLLPPVAVRKEDPGPPSQTTRDESQRDRDRGSRRSHWNRTYDSNCRKEGSSSRSNQDDPNSNASLLNNVYVNDGSFLDQFKKLAEGKSTIDCLKVKEETGESPSRDSKSLRSTSSSSDRYRSRDSKRDSNRESSRDSKSGSDRRSDRDRTRNRTSSHTSSRDSVVIKPRAPSPYSPSRVSPDSSPPAMHQYTAGIPPPSLLHLTVPLNMSQPPPMIGPPPPLIPPGIPPPILMPNNIPTSNPLPLMQSIVNLPPPSILTSQPPPLIISGMSVPPPNINNPPPLTNQPPIPNSLSQPQFPFNLPSGPPPPLPSSAQQLAVSTCPVMPGLAPPPLMSFSGATLDEVSPAASASDNNSCVSALTAASSQLARMVAEGGDDIEEMARERNRDDPSMWFLYQKESGAYKQYRDLVERLRATKNHLERELSCLDSNQVGMKREADNGADLRHAKKRRSRWGEKPESCDIPPIAVLGNPPMPPVVAPCNIPGGAMLSKVTRTDPNLLGYAMKSFGTTQLSEEDWKKCEDHYKVHLLYNEMLRKREQLAKLERAGKHKYEYDSDEEVDGGGTWEHKLRSAEMEATERWADELTKQAEGKHHIGDFLPPHELDKFMEKYSAKKEGREPDLSDYKEYKLKEDNIGFKMLQKLGWSEGQGLGSEGQGITDPVNKAPVRAESHGLGLERPEEVEGHDDEYEAYRKRMMLAYRFRPNPLNNPRRSYY